MDEVARLVEGLIRLCNNVFIFLVGGEVYNLIRNNGIRGICLVYLTVGSLDEAVLIDPCVGCK